MSSETFMMAVAFVVILGTAGYWLRRAIRVLRRSKAGSHNNNF
jgi:ABC-type nickel/cobalt efflux system permease component RcnA